MCKVILCLIRVVFCILVIGFKNTYAEILKISLDEYNPSTVVQILKDLMLGKSQCCKNLLNYYLDADKVQKTLAFWQVSFDYRSSSSISKRDCVCLLFGVS